MSAAELIAVRYGAMEASRSRLFHNFHTYGEPDAPASLAYYLWVLREGERVVLVDTGWDPAVARRRGRESLVEPLGALAGLGIEPRHVATILVSHFHYDHIGNLRSFPDAELVVPATEVEFWATPMARSGQFAAHVEDAELAVVEAARAEGRVREVGGETEVLPGVRAIEVGGHSPGQLMFLLGPRAEGDVLLTSDAVHLYEDFEADRPSSVVADLAAMYRAHARVRGLGAAGTTIVPGHDPLVMERFAPVDGVDFAVRIF
ncbi:MAG TPA: N-acyl homoserine lactonase family protein [Solirubrobacterales bacterium]|nr:N-acyl homoserine lactonase family protein [Solirubrobacterales bacterium]